MTDVSDISKLKSIDAASGEMTITPDINEGKNTLSPTSGKKHPQKGNKLKIIQGANSLIVSKNTANTAIAGA